MHEELVAPCGMNCAICSWYLAYGHDVKSQGIRMPYCIGCRPRDKKCAFLKKKCELLMSSRVRYCYECSSFPCEVLKRLDKPLRPYFGITMIENLEYIREHGVEAFLETEAAKWRCPECGAVICCHNGLCYKCQLDTLRHKKNKYRWEG